MLVVAGLEEQEKEKEEEPEQEGHLFVFTKLGDSNDTNYSILKRNENTNSL